MGVPSDLQPNPPLETDSSDSTDSSITASESQATSSSNGTGSSISTSTASERPSTPATSGNNGTGIFIIPIASASAGPTQVASGNNGINSQTLAAIVAPVVVVSVTIFLLVLFFLGRRSRRKKRDLQEVSHSQMRDASGGGVLKDNWRVSERASGVPLHGVHSNSFAEPIPRQIASLQIPSIQSPDEPPAIGNPQRGLRESTGNQAQETTRVSCHQYHDAGHAARTEGNLAAFTGENPERRSESPFDDPVRPDDVSDISRPGSPVDEMDSVSDVSSLDDEHDDHDGHNVHNAQNAHNEENQ
ncbi:hypothetical protein V8E54_011782 [Elaphomyces granulatus]